MTSPGASPSRQKMGPKTYAIEQIRAALPSTAKILNAIQAGFVEFSKDRVVVGNVSHLKFEGHTKHPGDMCVKSGYVRGDEFFVVKVASGWPNNQTNTKGAVSNSQGCMLVFSQTTGELQAVLADGGELTDIRTSAAACVCARALAPSKVQTIGFVGAGCVGSLTGLMMRKLFPEAKLLVWSRSKITSGTFKAKMEARGWQSVTVVGDAADVRECDVIVTSTPSETPLLMEVKKGAVVIALGADCKGKRELGPNVFKGACVVCDSKAQCLEFGECVHAVAEGKVRENGVAELGVLLAMAGEDGKMPLDRLGMEGKTTVVDLTGVAVQDVSIASLVYESLSQAKHLDADPSPSPTQSSSLPK